MKKSIYMICLCALMILVLCETKRVEKKKTSSGMYVPTARLVSCIKKENAKKTKAKKIAYLTFDDGPSENTEKVLKILKEKDAVASFFVIGGGVSKKEKKTIKQAIRQGNAVGVHTYYHEKEKVYLDKAHFFDDYNKTERLLEKITGKKPTLHRFPWGSNNGYVSPYVEEVTAELKKRGVKSFDWNVSGEDSIRKNVSKSEIFRNVKKDVTRFEKPIILLHDSSMMNQTVAVLPQIIDYIKANGYTFDTLENHPGYLFPGKW